MENPKIVLKQIISDDVISLIKSNAPNVVGQEILKQLKIQEELALFVLVKVT